MAEAFDLAAYKCTFLPKTLWMVTHSESQSRPDPGTGDRVAADSNMVISDQASLAWAVEQHVDWFNRQPSCFLSVFSDENHARRWAKQRDRAAWAQTSRDPVGGVVIREIRTEKLPADAYVFNVGRLCSRLGIAHPHSADEFIFLHRIPGRAFGRARSLEEIEEKEANAREYASRRFDPAYHYVSDLDGWYDTDEECEERNCLDDMLKMME